MKEIAHQLRIACLEASAGEMDIAERHVRLALKFMAESDFDVPRSVRGHIYNAGLALRQSDIRRAFSALDEALRQLEHMTSD
jgi:hypothetical protein